MKGKRRGLGRLEVTLAAVTALAAVYLTWAWTSSRPGPPPSPALATGPDGSQIGRFDHDDLAAFLAGHELPAPAETLPALEGGLASRLYEVLEALGRDPSAEGFGRTGQLFDFLKRPVTARACYARAMELDPDDHRWPHYLGRLAARSGDLPEAERRFRQAARLDPDFTATHAQLADVFLQAHRLEDAEAALNRVIRLDPQNAYAHTQLGRVALARADPPAAVGHLERALARDPQHGEAHALMARARAAMGDLDGADTHRRRATGAKPEMARLGDPLVTELLAASNSVLYLKILAREQHARRDWASLVATLEELARREPSNPAHTLDLAGTYLAVGRTDDAQRVTDEAMARAPGSARAHEMRARIALVRGEYETALAAADEALARDADHEPAHRARALALSRLGRMEEAIRSAEQATALDPDNAEAALLLERLRQAAGGR